MATCVVALGIKSGLFFFPARRPFPRLVFWCRICCRKVWYKFITVSKSGELGVVRRLRVTVELVSEKRLTLVLLALLVYSFLPNTTLVLRY